MDSMALDVLRSLSCSPESFSRGSGLSRTARLFVPAYGSRTAIRVNTRPPARANARRELARRITPRRKSS
jgi:hypothetical protein